MSDEQPAGPSNRDWANAGLQLHRLENKDPAETIYGIEKRMVINGVEHVQYVWLNQLQLRAISLDHGL